MKVCLLVKTTPWSSAMYQEFMLLSSDEHWGIALWDSLFKGIMWPWGVSVFLTFPFFLYYFAVWSGGWVVGGEQSFMSAFSIFKIMALSKFKAWFVGGRLKTIPGYFEWFVLYATAIMFFVLFELIPFVDGLSLSLHLLLIFSLSFYSCLEVSALLGNLSGVLASVVFPEVHPGVSIFAVVVEVVSQMIRPWAMAMRFTFHGITGVILLGILWHVVGLGFEKFVSLGVSHQLAWHELFSGGKEDLQGRASTFVQVSVGAVLRYSVEAFGWVLVFSGWGVSYLVECGFLFLQLGIFLFFILYFSLEHGVSWKVKKV